MILIKIIICFCLFFICCFRVNSMDFTNQLNDFFKKEYPFKKDSIKIIIHNRLKKNIFCKKPVFSAFKKPQYLGLIDVLLKCDEKKYYLKVEIQAKGEYIVANRNIIRGSKIQESDLKILIGQLHKLPNGTYRSKEDVINKVILRDISTLEPITSLMTRAFWLVRVNQEVTIVVNSDYFKIYSTGISLSNGAKNEKIRVKTKSGKIISGIVNKKGHVIVSL